MPVFDSGDGQQILHQPDQPDGVLVNIRQDGLLVRCLHGLAVGQQILRVAGDGGQGRTQVVGDGAQKVGPELFVFCQDGGFLLLAGILPAFNGQGPFSQDGVEDAAFQRLQGAAVNQNISEFLPGAVQGKALGNPIGGKIEGLLLRDPADGFPAGTPQDNGAIEQLQELTGNYLQNLGLVLRLIQLLGGFQQHLGPPGGLGGALCQHRQAVGQGAGEQ